MFFGSAAAITIGPTAVLSIMTGEYTKNIKCKEVPYVLPSMTILLTFLTGIVILLATVFRVGQ